MLSIWVEYFQDKEFRKKNTMSDFVLDQVCNVLSWDLMIVEKELISRVSGKVDGSYVDCIDDLVMCSGGSISGQDGGHVCKCGANRERPPMHKSGPHFCDIRTDSEVMSIIFLC